MKTKTPNKACLPQMPSHDAWAWSWQKHWSKAAQPNYELPPGEERDFLACARTPQKEKARLKRINTEFQRAFKTFYNVGPAVTVFGSARFKPTHEYYKLARHRGGTGQSGLCHADRRWPGNHGSCQSRCA